MPLILGSQSPRRREILSFFTLPFVQVPSHFDEGSLPFEGDPLKYTHTLAQKKGEILAHLYPTEIVLTADGVVYREGKVYNKPLDLEEAFRFLREFSGQWVRVITSVSVRKGEVVFTEHAETKLLFNTLTDEQIRKFHAQCNPLDKAGGFGIEKGGHLILSRLEGCYYNVLGLPLQTTRHLLLKMGIELWDFLKPI